MIIDYKKIGEIKTGDIHVQETYSLDMDTVPPTNKRTGVSEQEVVQVREDFIIVYDRYYKCDFIKKGEPDFKGGFVFPIKANRPEEENLDD